MSDHEKDSLMSCLFSGQDMKLKNIKFFRGSKDVITPEELRNQVHSAMMQKKTGAISRSSEGPKSKQPQVDVAALFADI